METRVYLSFSFTKVLTASGLAFPRAPFITKPITKPKAPLPTLSTCALFSAITRSTNFSSPSRDSIFKPNASAASCTLLSPFFASHEKTSGIDSFVSSQDPTSRKISLTCSSDTASTLTPSRFKDFNISVKNTATVVAEDTHESDTYYASSTGTVVNVKAGTIKKLQIVGPSEYPLPGVPSEPESVTAMLPGCR